MIKTRTSTSSLQHWLIRATQWSQHRLAVPALLILTLAAGLLAWQFNVTSDHTHNHRNTLATASVKVLAALPDRIEITAFSSNSPYKGRYFRKSIQSLVQRYQLVHHDIHLQFIDPSTAPSLARAQQIKKEGELIVRYRGQQQRMYLPYTEEAFTNLLLQLQHGERAPLVFASGQGEVALEDASAQGATQLAQAMQSAGMRVISSTDLKQLAPQDKKLPTLVLAGASKPYTQAQVSAIETHVRAGGNLVWLTTSAQAQGLQTLAQGLRLTISSGEIIDPVNQQFDIPLHALSTQRYSGQGPTQDFALRTFFDHAHAIQRERVRDDPLQTMPLVAAAERGWVSASYHADKHASKPPVFDQNTDVRGPATVILAMERKMTSGEFQRILVIGDNAFFSNAQQLRGGNQALTMQSLQWVVNNQPSVNLPVAPLRDSIIALPSQQTWLMLLFNGFQFGLPALLLLAGWLSWRRKHSH